MSQKNLNELYEKIKTLDNSKQDSLLIYIQDFLSSNDETNLPLQTHKFNLNFPLRYRSEKTLSDYEFNHQIAKQLAFYSEAIFWIINEFAELSWDGNSNIHLENMFQNLAMISEIGIVISSGCADYGDRSDLALTKEVKSNE